VQARPARREDGGTSAGLSRAAPYTRGALSQRRFGSLSLRSRRPSTSARSLSSSRPPRSRRLPAQLSHRRSTAPRGFTVQHEAQKPCRTCQPSETPLSKMEMRDSSTRARPLSLAVGGSTTVICLRPQRRVRARRRGRRRREATCLARGRHSPVPVAAARRGLAVDARERDTWPREPTADHERANVRLCFGSGQSPSLHRVPLPSPSPVFEAQANRIARRVPFRARRPIRWSCTCAAPRGPRQRKSPND
jgi:hypothetical protein